MTEKKEFFTVRDMIRFLEQFPQDLPVVIENNPIGLVNGVQGQEHIMFYYNRIKTNKMYLLFEDIDIKAKGGDERKSKAVLRISGYYK